MCCSFLWRWWCVGLLIMLFSCTKPTYVTGLCFVARLQIIVDMRFQWGSGHDLILLWNCLDLRESWWCVQFTLWWFCRYLCIVSWLVSPVLAQTCAHVHVPVWPIPGILVDSRKICEILWTRGKHKVQNVGQNGNGGQNGLEMMRRLGRTMLERPGRKENLSVNENINILKKQVSKMGYRKIRTRILACMEISLKPPWIVTLRWKCRFF